MLGDSIKAALESIGITDDRVERWLGKSCGGCKKRQEKFNSLHRWAQRILTGREAKARQYLDELLEESE